MSTCSGPLCLLIPRHPCYKLDTSRRCGTFRMACYHPTPLVRDPSGESNLLWAFFRVSQPLNSTFRSTEMWAVLFGRGGPSNHNARSGILTATSVSSNQWLFHQIVA